MLTPLALVIRCEDIDDIDDVFAEQIVATKVMGKEACPCSIHISHQHSINLAVK